ncbi:MAG: c-type cytochrome biogenesis protein CcsB [Geodermatophilaceae bacterium]|nr:c-type cytochrome biogenesis protein CcsB [Geodermatophilaceae bacterium]
MSEAASLADLADTLFTLTILTYSIATIAFAAEMAFSKSGPEATASEHRSERQRVRRGGSAEPTHQIQVLDATAGASGSSRVGRIAMGITLVGAVLHGGVLLLRGLAAQRVPLGNMFELATMVAFVGVGGFLFLAYRTPKLRGIGLFVILPVTIGLVLVGLLLYAESGPLVAALRSRWLTVHVTTVSIGFGAFLTSGIISALFLVRSRFEEAGSAARGMTARIGRRLPNSATLDRAAHRMVVFGFPIFTFAVIAGAVWAESAWGRFWGWDPKETWAFISWVVYASYLHARATAGWRGRAAAWINVCGLVVMLFNLLYVNIVISGLHSYAGIN